jgi:hypothetical protein
MKVFREFFQYSPEYWQTRCAVPTASQFGRILSPGSVEPRFTCVAPDGETCDIRHTSRASADKCAKKKGKEFSVVECPVELATGHQSYINELVGQAVHFDPSFYTERQPQSRAMEEGTRREPESRRWYAMHAGLEVEEIGFCMTDDGKWGASPDGLVGEEGVLELKNPIPETQVKYLREGMLPSDYLMQCHGHLLVTGRKWVDFVSYVPMFPPFVIRVVPDATTVKLSEALEQFWTRYTEARVRVLQMM